MKDYKTVAKLFSLNEFTSMLYEKDCLIECFDEGKNQVFKIDFKKLSDIIKQKTGRYANINNLYTDIKNFEEVKRLEVEHVKDDIFFTVFLNKPYQINEKLLAETQEEDHNTKLDNIVNDCNKVIGEDYISLSSIKSVIETYNKNVSQNGLKNVMEMKASCEKQKSKFDDKIAFFKQHIDYIDGEEFNEELKIKAESTKMCVESIIGTFDEMSNLTRQFIIMLETVIRKHPLTFGMMQIKKMSGLEKNPEPKKEVVKEPWSDNTKVILHSLTTFLLLMCPFSLFWIPSLGSLFLTLLIVVPVLCMIINTFYVVKKYDYLKGNDDVEENILCFVVTLFISPFFSLWHFIKALLGHYDKPKKSKKSKLERRGYYA